MLAIQTQNQISAVLWPQACRCRAAFFAAGRRRRVAASARNASQSSGARPEAPGSSSEAALGTAGPEAPRSGAGSRGRAPAAAMGKGMGAVDKNMRKELSLEIDGHACAAVCTPSPRRQPNITTQVPGSIRK